MIPEGSKLLLLLVFKELFAAEMGLQPAVLPIGTFTSPLCLTQKNEMLLTPGSWRGSGAGDQRQLWTETCSVAGRDENWSLCRLHWERHVNVQDPVLVIEMRSACLSSPALGTAFPSGFSSHSMLSQGVIAH